MRRKYKGRIEKNKHNNKQMEEKQESGHFSLFPLFGFVAEHPALPPILNKGEKSTPYQAAAVELLKKAKVPQKGGWYVWGKFNDAGYYAPIYVGMASLGKTSNLFVRLREEFRNEYLAVFATVYGRYWASTAAKKIYKERVKRGKKDYSDEIERNLRKTDTHFVMWTTAPTWMTKKDIERVETTLINVFRPGFNMKRPKIDVKALYEDPKVHPFIVALEYEIGKILGEKLNRTYNKEEISTRPFKNS
jgi:hypothetical protein